MQRSEEGRGPRQITLSLCDSCFCYESIHVVRRDIENLIELPQCFGETTKTHIGKRVLGEHVDIARVEPLDFVEVGLAFIPLTSPPRDIGQRFRNQAAIGQELTCRSEEHTSELQSRFDLVCRLLLEKKK